MRVARLSPLPDEAVAKASVNSAQNVPRAIEGTKYHAYDPKLGELPMSRGNHSERSGEARTGMSFNAFG